MDSSNLVRMYISKFITWGGIWAPKPFTVCPINDLILTFNSTGLLQLFYFF